jgi:hypothetical protein
MLWYIAWFLNCMNEAITYYIDILRDFLKMKRLNNILNFWYKDLRVPVPYTWSLENEATTYYIDILRVGFLRKKQQHYADILRGFLKTKQLTY